MAHPVYVFLDFDDTLSDHSTLGRLYVSKLAALLCERLGGNTNAWATVLKPALDASIARYVETFTGNPLAGYNEWIARERVRVTEEIFEATGRSIPNDEPVEKLALRLQFEALSTCNAAFRGAICALRTLRDRGVRIQMASSQESEYLRAGLIGAGLDEYIETLFGPDLVDCAKEGPEFYRCIFKFCEIHPSQAVIVDDQAMCLDWAEEAGARVVQARLKPQPDESEFPVIVTELDSLPQLIEDMVGPRYA